MAEILLTATDYTLVGKVWLLSHLLGLEADTLTVGGTTLKLYDATGTLVYTRVGCAGAPLYDRTLGWGSCEISFWIEPPMEAPEWTRVEIVTPGGLILWDVTLDTPQPYVGGQRDYLTAEMRLLTTKITPDAAEHWWRLVTGDVTDWWSVNSALVVYDNTGASLGRLGATSAGFSASTEVEWIWNSGPGIQRGIWHEYAVESPGGVELYRGPADYAAADKSGAYTSIDFHHNVSL